uniref:Uncharacterized protein n=1 Tax=Lygus hesperus TaxID=30085 RepID=A0A0A9VVH4_LYGHE
MQDGCTNTIACDTYMEKDSDDANPATRGDGGATGTSVNPSAATDAGQPSVHRTRFADREEQLEQLLESLKTCKPPSVFYRSTSTLDTVDSLHSPPTVKRKSSPLDSQNSCTAITAHLDPVDDAVLHTVCSVVCANQDGGDCGENSAPDTAFYPLYVPHRAGVEAGASTDTARKSTTNIHAESSDSDSSGENLTLHVVHNSPNHSRNLHTCSTNALENTLVFYDDDMMIIRDTHTKTCWKFIGGMILFSKTASHGATPSTNSVLDSNYLGLCVRLLCAVVGVLSVGKTAIAPPPPRFTNTTASNLASSVVGPTSLSNVCCTLGCMTT